MLSPFTREQLGAASADALSDELERGRVVSFPQCPIALPSAEDLEFLRTEMPKALVRKNVSLYPNDNRLVGIDGGPQAERVRGLLAEHGRRVDAFFRERMPRLTVNWEVGTSSFRPLEERGRDLKPHASNELIHVDAGAYGATHGDRILRFFVNVHPTQDRVWSTKGTFDALWARYGTSAIDLREGPLDRLRSGLLSRLERAGVGWAKSIDGSPYDRTMRRFHNFMKDDPAFRASKDGYQELRFPPFSAWAVFTDLVSHACVSGQHAFVNTFVVRLAQCRFPELAPFHVLQRAASPAAAPAA